MKVKHVLILAAVLMSMAGAWADSTQHSTAAGTVTWTWYSSGNYYYISEVTLNRGVSNHGDGYDGALRISVSGPVESAGTLHFSSTYAMAVQHVAVTNTTGSTQTYTISCFGNLGSDSSTTWHYTRANGPYYTVSSDRSSAFDDAGDPVISFLYGDSLVNSLGTSRAMPFNNGSDTHSFEITNVSIAPGEVHGYLFLGGAGHIDDALYNRAYNTFQAVQNLTASVENWPDDFTDFLTEDQLRQIVNWDMVTDDLQITPTADLDLYGYEGGPFFPTNLHYTLTNLGTSNLDWQVNTDPGADWLTITPAAGSLGGGGMTNVVFGASSNASARSVGTYPGALTVLNTTSGYEQTRGVNLLVYPVPQVPAAPMSPVPAAGAVGITYNTALTWEHDNPSLESPYVPDTRARYDVYLGTSATNLVQVAAGLTNTVYVPGLLDIDTTYYWQVVASNFVGSTTGALWQFTTWISGPVDHFEWAMETNQLAHQPFPVMITARDVHGYTVVDFTNQVELLGLSAVSNGAIVFEESFEGTDLAGWEFNTPSSMTVRTTTDFSADGAQSLVMESSALIYQDLIPSRPSEIEFSVRIGSGAEGALLLGDYPEFDAVTSYLYFYGGTAIQPSGPSFPYTTDEWHHIRWEIDWNTRTMDLYFDEVLMDSDIPFLGISETIGQIWLMNFSAYSMWFDGIQMASGENVFAPMNITPTGTTEFSSGVWTGKVTVLEIAERAVLRADDEAGHTGDSPVFEVGYLAALSVILPDEVTESDGILAGGGQVVLSQAQTNDLAVQLSANDDSELTVPAELLIPAGATNVSFDLTVIDDGLLDGAQPVVVRAVYPGYLDIPGTVYVNDDETAVLTLSLPASTVEGAGSVNGVLILDRAPDVDVTVELLSDNPAKIMNSTVLIPAGHTYVTFSLAIEDNQILDGVQTAIITAHVENWTDSQASIFIYDNEAAALQVALLQSTVSETGGMITNAGMVSLSSPSEQDLTVAMRLSDPSQASIPLLLSIPAGQSNAVFELEVYDNAETDGARNLAIIAETPGYVSGLAYLTILDNEVHHLEVDGLSGDIPVRQEVSITITASTIDGYPADGFDGPVHLSAAGDRGSIVVTPSVITNFAGGTATNAIEFGNVGNDAMLYLEGGAIQGTSSVFNVVGPQIVLTVDPLTNVLVVAGHSVTSGVAISNAGNTHLEYRITDPSLMAYYPFDGDAYDHSGNEHHAAVNGAVPTTDRFGALNSAYHFDGTASYMDLGEMGNFKTVSMWVRQGSRSSYDFYFGHDTFRLYATSTTGGELKLGDGGGTSTISTTVQMDSYQNEWVHIVGISDGTNSAVYFNGENVGSGTLEAVSTNIVNLGRWPEDTHYLNGDLDDVRVYGRALSEEEILALYSETRLDEGLAASYPFDGNAEDISGNGLDATVYNAALVTDRFDNPDSAYHFNGTTRYIQFPQGIVSGMTECTFSMWIIMPSAYQWSRIFDFGTGESINMFLTPRSSDNTFRFAITASGGPGEQRIDAPIPSFGQWHHIVVSMGSGGGTIHVDGNLAGANPGMTLSPASLGITTQNWIGRSQYSSDPYYRGRVDDFRIFSRKLSQQEIEALYNEGGETGEGHGENWLMVAPASGSVPPGGSETVSVLYSADGRIAGDYAESLLRIACNDADAPRNDLPVSMWVLPPAPVMNPEPETTDGETNGVSWTAVAGPVDYEAVVVADTNAAPLDSSSWVVVTNHLFSGLSADTRYFYRVRASISNQLGRLEGPWSEWVWSTQQAVTTDTDGDGLPGWWEELHFGGPTNAVAWADDDGDGQSNLEEFIAGMDPTNAASFFKALDGRSSGTGGYVIRWDAVTGRVYSIYWAPALTNGVQMLETNLHYPRNSYTDSVHEAESAGFYQVGVELE